MTTAKKKAPKRVTKPRKRAPKLTLRKVLDQIDEVLARDDNLSQGLWDVLTALRGPDNGSIGLKMIGTVHIRRAAFPKTADSAGGHFANGAAFSSNKKFDVPEPIGGHDVVHIYRAAKALGLVKAREASGGTVGAIST